MKHSLLTQAMVACASFFVMGAAPVEAQADQVDLGTLVADQTYTIPQLQEVSGEYTPSVTGPVTFVWTGSPLALYTSAGHEEESIVQGQHSYGNGTQIMSYKELTGGKTYYVYSPMTMVGGELVIREGDNEIEMVKVEPAADAVFSASKDYRIYVYFNYPVTIGNTFLIAGDQRERLNPIVDNTSVCCDVNDVVMNYYRQGIIKEGDTMTLRILQVKDAFNEENKYNDNGRLEIDFTVGAKPAELVETKGFKYQSTDNTFYSYYFPGDEAAKMQLVFDAPIDPSRNPVANIVYGNTDNLDLGLYSESLPGVVDGNVVTFDFAGKLRSRNTMLPGAEAGQLPESIYISYNDIYTFDGQRGYTGVLSNPSGFPTSYNIVDLQYNIAADFTPVRGSVLKPGNQMEIWVMNGAMLRYDNICIDYIEGGASKTITIPEADVTVAADPESATGLDMVYNFTVPEFAADEDSEIIVYMSNVRCADGIDHSDDVRGEYKANDSGAGVAGVESADIAGDVYDVAGRLVLRSATRSQLGALDKGIYIYKGKKIAIK